MKTKSQEFSSFDEVFSNFLPKYELRWEWIAEISSPALEPAAM
jgi:hypothetical protein